MKNIFFNRWYLYGVLIIVVLLIIAEGIVQTKNDATIADTQTLVDHTYDVLRRASTVLALTKELQSSDRAYIITGSQSFTNVIDSDANAVRLHIDTLSQLTLDNPLQQKRIDTLVHLVNARIHFSKRYVALKDSLGITAAAELMKEGKGIAISNNISALIGKMQLEERRLLALRKAANLQSIKRLKYYYFIPFLCLAIIITFLIVFILLKSNENLQRQILQKSAEIEKRAKRFEVLLQNSFEGIVLLDKDLNYIYKGTSVEKITGYTLQEHDNVRQRIDMIHPEDRPGFDSTLKKVFQNPDQSFQVLYRALHKKNYYVWIEAIITNRLMDVNVQAIVFNIRDVSAKVEMEQQKDEFLTMVSHELRTPVTSLSVLGHILHEKFFTKKEEESLSLITRLNAQTNKLTRLINDLVEINKLNIAQLQYAHSLFYLDKIVDDVIADINSLQLTHTIIKQHVEPIAIFGDKDRIVQVLNNLILNAVKYSPHGSAGNC